MEDINKVANWFLSKEPMTHKKLQKLCYYAQAWYCALYNGKPLFKERIEAWVHGPVAPALYSRYADYGWEQIPKCEDVPDFEEKELKVLEAVYRTYSGFSGDQLEALTHSEEPWCKARGSVPPWVPSNEEITTQSMREYYLEKYRADQND